MKKIYIFTKSLWQVMLVVIEIVFATSGLVLLSKFLRPIEDNLDIIERYILFIAVYEIFVYVLLSFLNDARKDALLALKTSFEYAQLYCKTGYSPIKSYLREKIDMQLENSIFNHIDIRKEYENLREYIDNQDIGTIQFKLIGLQHNYEMCDLQWRFTFLLRQFK